MTIKKLENENFTTVKATILDRMNHGIRKYYNKEYILHINNNQIISMLSNNSMHIKGENSFEGKLATAIKTMNRISLNITERLEEIMLEEKVKEYQIKRSTK